MLAVLLVLACAGTAAVDAASDGDTTFVRGGDECPRM